MTPANRNFLLNDSGLGYFEGGIRYNFSAHAKGFAK